MKRLRIHFLVGYGMIGAISPFFPEFLRSNRGFSAAQIGGVFAISQISYMIAPVVLTYLADRRVSSRWLSTATFGIAVAAIAGLWNVESFWPIVALYAVFGFSASAMIPSMDGLFFAVQRSQSLAGQGAAPYHRTRVFGTIGFIIPSIILLAWIPKGGNLEPILPATLLFASLALINGLGIPDPRLSTATDSSRAKLPTIEAIRTLFSGRTLAFSIGIATLQVASVGYYTFYPVHLVESLGLEARWLGQVATLGVLTEAGLMFAFGWFCQRLGLRRILAIGAALTAVRMLLIAIAPNAWLAVAANLLHGPIILGTLVAPVIFINRLAGDSFRNSIQGVLVVAVMGPARILGNFLCGWLAGSDTRYVFGAGAVAALVSAVLFALFVSEPGEEA